MQGLPPTVREVQAEFGFRAVQSAREHLERLVEEGRLSKKVGKARGYALPGSDHVSPQLVPILGRIQAGDLNEAIEYPDGHVPVETRRGRARELFALRVQGESMRGAGILPGDLVIVKSQPTAESGEIVVALVDDEATVKRLKLRRGRVELHPENPDFEPIRPAGACSVLGKVIEVRRCLE